jgi:adenine-specific DNA-methyltransferase
MEKLDREKERLRLQSSLDEKKTQADRNRLGQFATPTTLAQDVLKIAVAHLGKEGPIRFLDPAVGTGSFFSALLNTVSTGRIDTATGFELDPHYGHPSALLWRGTQLNLALQDFTKTTPPGRETDLYNLVICNPPYVRHHHLGHEEKIRLQNTTKVVCGFRISGLAGLYCYFLGLSHGWMQQGAIAGWLVPSEFMDVNYGEALKRYLLNKVTLIRIHRFAPEDVQFHDALVSSAVVWFRNNPSSEDHAVELSLGGSLTAPAISRKVSVSVLRNESKWTRFPVLEERTYRALYPLSDFFTIKRGIATGNNKFFILTPDQIQERCLPWEVFRPILPSPRYIPVDEIESNHRGIPILDRLLFLLDCRLPETLLKTKYPKLWTYLEEGKEETTNRYLCRSRKRWYFQEERQPAPILCTYLGRSDTKNRRPFRFLLNHSQATAANVYLLLYPKPVLENAVRCNRISLRQVWCALNDLSPASLLGEGRVYGGGLHKLEPNELANVDASSVASLIPGVQQLLVPEQLSIFQRKDITKSSTKKSAELLGV